MNWHTGRELDRRIAQQEEFQSGANRQESKNTTSKFVVLGGTIWRKIGWGGSSRTYWCHQDAKKSTKDTNL